MTSTFAYALDPGSRKEQQDAVFAEESKEYGLSFFVLCDGAGGHGGGAEASRAVVNYAGTLWDHVTGALSRGDEFKGEDFLQYFFDKANEKVVQAGEQYGGDSKAVVVALLRWDGMLYWGHMGDSRLYLVENGKTIHRTLDHSAAQAAVNQNEITEEELPHFKGKNEVFRALGFVESCKPELRCMKDAPDKCRFAILCSDGFWGPLEKRRWKIDIQPKYDLKDWARFHIQEARKLGGENADNLSVVVARFGKPRRKSSLNTILFLCSCLLIGVLCGLVIALITGRL